MLFKSSYYQKMDCFTCMAGVRRLDLGIEKGDNSSIFVHYYLPHKGSSPNRSNHQSSGESDLLTSSFANEYS